MRLDFALLADGVVQRQDGKFDVFGAGIDQVFAVALPARHPSLTVLLRLILGPLETRSPHTLEFHVLDPDGQPRIQPLKGQVGPADERNLTKLPAGQPIPIATVIKIEGIVFERYGPHAIVILWDGNELTRLRLNVTTPPQAPGGQPDNES